MSQPTNVTSIAAWKAAELQADRTISDEAPKSRPKQSFDNTLFLAHSGPHLFWVVAGRGLYGQPRYLGAEHRVSNEAARAEGARLGMLYWGPNGGPFAPIDAPYPGKGYTGKIQGADGKLTSYVDGKRVG